MHTVRHAVEVPTPDSGTSPLAGFLLLAATVGDGAP